VTDGVRIVFETHSLTTDNEEGIATVWLGGTLSERGRAFAAGLGERRRADGIDVVYSSDPARAVETAEMPSAGPASASSSTGACPRSTAAT
jgi:broad specificity phosphatase PhoE